MQNFEMINKLSMSSSDIYITNIKDVISNAFEKIKSEHSKTKKDLSNDMNVHFSLLTKWTKTSSISIKHLIMLCAYCPSIYEDINNANIRLKSRNGIRMRIPEINEDIAYFLGMMAGDGSIPRNSNSISIAGKSREIIKASEIIHNSFNLKPKINDYENYSVLNVDSSTLRAYLIHVIGLPEGPKKDVMRMPDIIKRSSKEIKFSFVKGFFESDGSLSIRDSNRKTLSFKQTNVKFLQELKDLLESEGIKSSIYPDRTMNSWSLSIFKGEEIKKLYVLMYGNAAVI